MSAPAYHQAVGAFFSGEGAALDEQDRSNAIHAYFRRVSLETLARVFSPPGPLLEFGYGTGTEAIWLAKRGYAIVGVDPSPGMRARAVQKAAEAGVSDRCDFREGSTASVAELTREFGGGHFAGAFATLGPLNCEPSLPKFAENLSRVLAPKGALVAAVINRYCVWETALYLAAGKFKKAFRREVRGWGDLVDAQTSARIPVFHHTPGSFGRAFAPHFTVEELFALPVFLPPPYANRRLAKLGSLSAALTRADEQLRGRFPLRALGDHFEVVLRAHAGP